MGRRGPPKMPVETLKLHGTFRPDKHNNSPPEPPRDMPECPAWLDDVAKERWAFLVDKLVAMQLQTSADMPLLEQYCHAYSQWRKMIVKIEETGYVSFNEKGGDKINPYVQIEGRLWDQMERALGKLGFNPSARASLHVDKRPQQTGVSRRAK